MSTMIVVNATPVCLYAWLAMKADVVLTDGNRIDDA